MGKEYQHAIGTGKPASGPKNAREINSPSTARVSGRRKQKGYRPKQRNDLYELARQFKANQPQATAADAWRHFSGLAGMGLVVLAFDVEADSLTYVPDVDRYGTRTIKRRSFESRYYELATD